MKLRARTALSVNQAISHGGPGMSSSNQSPAKKVVQLPDQFEFGMEKRDTITASKINYDSDSAECGHKWYQRAREFQTLADEGKTIWECNDCRKVSITYEWEKP
jgi:hypothetical protein